ncbi:MAG: hypothetical protein WC184_01190 [Acidimicrobiia bacterium]
MKVKSVAVGLTLIAFVMTLVGCGGDSKPAGEALVGVVGNDNTATTVAGPETAWTGAASPTAADVEAAYAELVACYLESGLSGYMRFDLSRSHVLTANIVLGKTEKEAETNEIIMQRCRRDFEAVMDPYLLSHPENDAQLEAVRQRLLACADKFFPGKIDPDIYLDDLTTEYNSHQKNSDEIIAAGECLDEAWAGPKRHFGES